MRKRTEVKCDRGGMLTVGFHNAEPRMVWRFDMKQTPSFSLAMQGDDNGWELGMTSANGVFAPIAHFDQRDDADEAFAKVEQALTRGAGWGRAVFRGLMAVAALAIIIAATVIGFGAYQLRQQAAATMPAAQPMTTEPTLKSGVPMSADDVLKPPSP